MSTTQVRCLSCPGQFEIRTCATDFERDEFSRLEIAAQRAYRKLLVCGLVDVLPGRRVTLCRVAGAHLSRASGQFNNWVEVEVSPVDYTLPCPQNPRRLFR